jgi:hypothetical protein
VHNGEEFDGVHMHSVEDAVPNAVGALGRAADSGADTCKRGVVVDGTPGLGVSQPLLDCLPDIDLVREVIPARPSRKLIDKTSRIVADVRRVGHDRNLSWAGGAGN